MKRIARRAVCLALSLYILAYSAAFAQNEQSAVVPKEQAVPSKPSSGTGVVTALSFFKSLSDRYAAIADYEAHVTITTGATMTAELSCKPPLLRMDFSAPRGQTIVFNGDALIVYLPSLSAVLQQVCDIHGGTSLGLQLISRYYAVQYAPANEDDGLNIVRLVAYPRGASEAFRSITMEVDRNEMLIMNVKAVSRSGGTTEMAFSDYKLNQGIPSERFVYDPPSSANYYNNFLSGSES